MYKLSLTLQDISFLEWAYNKYCVGDILPLISEYGIEPSCSTVTYTIPEHTAWEVRRLIEEDTEEFKSSVPCASKEISDKLILWAMEIV